MDEARKVGRPSNEDKLKEVHARALKRFDDAQEAQSVVREQCVAARRFYSIPGAQWDGPVGEQFANKPRFELNKVHLSVIRVVNEYRNNRISVDFVSKDGTSNDDLADTCDGLYRADEKACTADEAYDNAFEEGVGGGMGAWRLRADYEDEYDEDDDRQRVKIEPIVDADTSVYWDPDAKRYDKADAKWCIVLTSMSPEAYTEEYGGDPASWDKAQAMCTWDWVQPDVVYVAEYYEVEEKKEKIHIFRGLDEQDMSVPDSELAADPEKLQTLLATGFQLVRQKRVKRCKVHKYILSGIKVEEDEGYIAGRCIPIVPFYAKRWFVDNVERCMGHVQLAIDAQRLINMLMSWLAEAAAKFGGEKPILTPEQIDRHKHMWARDAIEQFPYLLLEPTEMPDGTLAIPPIQYTKAPGVPPAMAALMELAEASLQDLLGNQQAGEEIQPNLSGKAVELIQNRLDMQTYIYLSNFAKSMKRAGEIWVSMMRDIAVEESRAMKTVDAEGKPGSTVINEPSVDPETGATGYRNDMSKANFDVDVDVGPSSGSKRQATVRALTGVMAITQDPQTLQALTYATISNLDGEGLQDLRDWARAQGVRMGVIKPTEEEQKQLAQEQQNQQPDPQAQYLQAEAMKSMEETKLAQAKTIDTLHAAELKDAQTKKTLSEVGIAKDAQRNDVLKHASGMQMDMAKHQDGQAMHREDRDHQAQMAKEAAKAKPAQKA